MSDMLTGAESAPTNDAPTTQEAGAPTEPTPTQQGPDLSRLEQRMAEQMEAMQRQIADQLQQYRPAEPDQDDLEPDLDPDDPDYDEQMAQRALNEWFETEYAKRREPEVREQRIRERDQEWEAFLEEFSDMQQDNIRKPVLQAAQQFAQRVNPDIVNSPEFIDLIELVYKAQRADERAAQEKPAGERKEVVLEGAGGAAPAEPEEDLAARIVAAGTKNNPLLF